MLSHIKALSLLSLTLAVNATPVKKSTFDWSKIDYLFQLGDSYTSIGNTAQAPGEIFSFLQPRSSTGGGPMWGTVLSVNGSTNPNGTQQIDYAVSGATVNNSIVSHPVSDMLTQASLFKKDFFPPPSNTTWTAENSLHTFFFGINDVANSQDPPNQNALHERILDSYENALEILYSAGSRNWLFLNIPPFERAHYGIEQGREKQKPLGKSIVNYNKVLETRLKAFCKAKSDVNCIHFDTYSLFDSLIKNPKKNGFMSGIEFCLYYALNNSVTPSYEQTFPCQPLPHYLWLNDLHPTWPVHKILAERISDLLRKS